MEHSRYNNCILIHHSLSTCLGQFQYNIHICPRNGMSVVHLPFDDCNNIFHSLFLLWRDIYVHVSSLLCNFHSYRCAICNNCHFLMRVQCTESHQFCIRCTVVLVLYVVCNNCYFLMRVQYTESYQLCIRRNHFH